MTAPTAPRGADPEEWAAAHARLALPLGGDAGLVEVIAAAIRIYEMESGARMPLGDALALAGLPVLELAS